MEEFISKFWYLIVAVITFTIWLIRLENKVKNNEDDIEDLKGNQKEEIKTINTKLDTMYEKLTDICLKFERLTGYLERYKEEQDVKQ